MLHWVDLAAYDRSYEDEGDFVIKGVDDRPVFLSQKSLQERIDYNSYGDFMAEKI